MHHAPCSGRTAPHLLPIVFRYSPSHHTQVGRPAIPEIGKISIPPTMYVIKQLSINASGVLYAQLLDTKSFKSQSSEANV